MCACVRASVCAFSKSRIDIDKLVQQEIKRGGITSPKETDVDVESMPPAERRRHERNLREQQRSYRISQQIKELREVLTESSVPFKPNKYSILLSVVDYIKQLKKKLI